MTFTEGVDRPRSLDGHEMPGNEILMFQVEAANWEEACSIRNLRLGFEPYTPNGSPQPCPKCSSYYYPEGSGVCWRCGKI